MNRARPTLIRLSGKAPRRAPHSGSAHFRSRGTGCTRAARKFERRLLQLLGVRLYLAGRTALMRGRMNCNEAGVLLGSTPVTSLMRIIPETRSRRRVAVREGVW